MTTQSHGGRSLPIIDMPAAPGALARTKARGVEARALERELAAALEGEVRFDTASKALYATDSSNFRQIPIGVVVPRTAEDVVTTHRLCAKYGAPILNRGTGTSLSGETVNVAVVIDHSKYRTRIGAPDVERRLVTVEPGAINEVVNHVTGKVGLVFGPDPSTHAYCTIGGNVGNNSCGVHSVQSQLYGPGPRTSDNVHAMEVVLYGGERFRVENGEEARLDAIIARGGRQGEIYRRLRALRDRYAPLIRARYPSVSELPRRVSGYNLDELLPEKGFNVARALVGTESTCATALEVTLMLTPALLERGTVVVEYEDIVAAAEHVEEIVSRWRPIALEAIDDELAHNELKRHVHEDALRNMPRPGGKHSWLLVQFGADTAEEAEDLTRRFADWLTKEKRYDRDRIAIHEARELGGDSESLWQVREGGLGSTAFAPGGQDHWPGWEDSAVPPSKLGPYVAELKKLYEKYGYDGALYGHFGQGCVHSRISFDLRTPEGVRAYRTFLYEAADLVVKYGGSLSGEHGDGQQRAELLVKQYGEELLQAMREFKAIWDPEGKMNPGKVVDPFRVDENLKLGVDYNPWRPEVKFAYEEDHGDFAHATLRCVGVGKCREPHAVDVMCPSYVATREEKHATRGRARLLFEMLEGEVVKDGWQSQEVFDALDLCLACKGCTNECPVHVDMPTYKAEFLYHHYRSLRRNRPRHAYAFGFIDQAARLASLVPEVANFATQTPGLKQVARLVAGIDEHREIPRFAPMTLQQWFRKRPVKNPGGRRVLLWPDTFNNHFHTQVGVAVVEALEEAGFRVVMPQGHVCCGRPLYDYGFLGVAERYLRRTLRVLRDEIRAGTPLVGIEPSCLAVFKDELGKLLPHDDDGKRLAQNAFHFAELFERYDLEVPRLDGKAIVWGHCHHKATGGIAPEVHVLKKKMGLDVDEAQGGCCGLAGSFGFERGKHEISMQCAEIGFLPAVRAASPEAVIVADGFSCKTQLEQSGLDRRALHVAEVMKIAREHGAGAAHAQHPERLASTPPAPPTVVRVARTAVVAGAAAALGVGALWLGRSLLRRRRRQARGVRGLLTAAAAARR